MEGTIAAHVEGDVPNILINMEELNEETMGYLIYFFELACAMSGNLLGVDPFNQPGVEKYKTNMFKLLKNRDMKKIRKTLAFVKNIKYNNYIFNIKNINETK